jgi:hypothetical protein
MRGARIGWPLAVVIALTSAFTIAFAAPVGAAQNVPPGWQNPADPPNAWAGFRANPFPPSPSGRSGAEPVTLTRETNLTDPSQLLNAFNNWEPGPIDPSTGKPSTWYWPTVFEGGGIRLERVTQCVYTDATCTYRFVSGAGADFFFFGGTPPIDPTTNQPTVDVSKFDLGAVHLPTPKNVVLGSINAVGIADPAGGPGKIHIEAPGTHDELSGTTLSYQWTILGPDGKVYTPTDATPDVTVDKNGVYCFELKVTASDGNPADAASISSPSCNDAKAPGYTALISNVEPAHPAPTPAPSTGGGGPTGGGFPGIVFSPPAQRAPAVLSRSVAGGGSASPTIVWLWRPEWYQSPAETPPPPPRTAGLPQVKGRREIVVQHDVPHGASAGPWLAGLGAFGLLGGGWVLSRRRRMRMLAEL